MAAQKAWMMAGLLVRESVVMLADVSVEMLADRMVDSWAGCSADPMALTSVAYLVDY